ncbi:hypothetical protein M7I_2014 [Glarea lozoyensis 74030]|uniref:Uncharacterized protein n=1 Tax=Glarea lozoyensis (strain ATCC 74030 / MF5533) TaxID=1104152 RepID=H0EHN0_GLAL7|nr:hypothetical protein M7I_2014 [Glarea lozoyensis 74030]
MSKDAERPKVSSQETSRSGTVFCLYRPVDQEKTCRWRPVAIRGIH